MKMSACVKIFALILHLFVIYDGVNCYADVSNITAQLWKCNSDFPVIPNSSVSFYVAHNPVGKISCNKGYTLRGDDKLMCIDNEWHYYELPMCAKDCSKAEEPENGYVRYVDLPTELEEYRDGSNSYYHCNADFILEPEESLVRKCNNGKWEGEQPFCTPLNGRCPPPTHLNGAEIIRVSPTFQKGIFKPNNQRVVFNIGDVVEYVCVSPDDYLVGNNRRTCTKDGKWSNNDLPECLKVCYSLAMCDNPLIMPYARIRPYYPLRYVNNGNMNSVGSRIIYECYGGYTLVGDSVFTCERGGCWYPPKPPVCQPSLFDADRKKPTNQLEMPPLNPDDYEYEGEEDEQEDFFGGRDYEDNRGMMEDNGGDQIAAERASVVALFQSLATGLGVLIILLIVCCFVMSKSRKFCNHANTMVQENRIGGAHPHHVLELRPDELALMANNQRFDDYPGRLPTYEEATRGTPAAPCRALRLHHHCASSSSSSRPRTHPNSVGSNSTSTKSGGDSMGSTDTMAVSENSTTVTLDTISSHSGSQAPSCRVHCGSLASFDMASNAITEGAPLLEDIEEREARSIERMPL